MRLKRSASQAEGQCADLSREERDLLATCDEIMGEIEQQEEPADYWAKLDWEDAREYGPRYRPAEWFGGGEALPPKWQSRYLRAVHRLHNRGLIEMFTEAGRLSNIKLTPAGRAMVAQLERAEQEAGG